MNSENPNPTCFLYSFSTKALFDVCINYPNPTLKILFLFLLLPSLLHPIQPPFSLSKKPSAPFSLLCLSATASLPFLHESLLTYSPMGKYIKKSKSSREITLIDASQSSSYIGVRTRAKTLALKRLQKISNSPSPPPSPATSGSYLQLRSRRLHKPPSIAIANDSRKQKLPQRSSNARGRRLTADSGGTSRLGVCSVADGSIESVSRRRGDGEVKDVAVEENEMVVKQSEVQENVNVLDIGAQEEASFGENLLDFEGRMSRESTPCSLIRKPESIRTPSSSTKASSTTDERVQLQNSSATDVPTAREVDDFFNCAEGEQQRKFIEKYNFDPITDKPLPGRYEWEKLDD